MPSRYLKPLVCHVLIITVIAAVHWALTGGAVAHSVAIETRSGGLHSSAIDEAYELLAAYMHSWWQLPLVGPPLVAVLWSTHWLLEELGWRVDPTTAWATTMPMASLLWAAIARATWAAARMRSTSERAP